MISALAIATRTLLEANQQVTTVIPERGPSVTHEDHVPDELESDEEMTEWKPAVSGPVCRIPRS